MKSKKYTTEDKIRILREADAGKGILEVCRAHNISEVSFHRRELAKQAVEARMCSQRAACRILRLARSTYSYRGSGPSSAEMQMRRRLHELSQKHLPLLCGRNWL